MIDVVVRDPVWIDAVAPTPDELFGLARDYRLHPSLVNDCMDPNHLPKHERHDQTTFIIVRHYDHNCDPTQDSVQAMTRKLALFLGDGFLISVHRSDPEYLTTIREKYRNADKAYLQVVLLELLLSSVETFHRPLEAMEIQIHGFERAILRNVQGLGSWEEVFRTKCKLTVIKRVLWHSLNTVQKFVPHSEMNLPMRQDLVERIENLQFFVDSLLDDLNNLLNIQLSLATHRANEASTKTNEVMKVLTLFSAFFLPMNFIVGIYGMNFVNIPELRWHYGYFAVWGVLLATFAGIYAWFVRKGWIRVGHLS